MALRRLPFVLIAHHVTNQGELTAVFRFGVNDFRSFHVRKRSEGVLFGRSWANDFEHFDAARQQRIGNKRTVAAPRHRLRAHQRRRFFKPETDGVLDSGVKFRRLHVVGISAEAFVAPAQIDGILPWMAQTAQIFHVHIVDSSARQRIGQRFAAELRMATGFGNGANIDELLHAIRLQQIDKFFNRARGVTNGEDSEF